MTLEKLQPSKYNRQKIRFWTLQQDFTKSVWIVGRCLVQGPEIALKASQGTTIESHVMHVDIEPCFQRSNWALTTAGTEPQWHNSWYLMSVLQWPNKDQKLYKNKQTKTSEFIYPDPVYPLQVCKWQHLLCVSLTDPDQMNAQRASASWFDDFRPGVLEWCSARIEWLGCVWTVEWIGVFWSRLVVQAAALLMSQSPSNSWKDQKPRPYLWREAPSNEVQKQNVVMFSIPNFTVIILVMDTTTTIPYCFQKIQRWMRALGKKTCKKSHVLRPTFFWVSWVPWSNCRRSWIQIGSSLGLTGAESKTSSSKYQSASIQ